MQPVFFFFSLPGSEVAETEGNDLQLHYLVEKDGVFIWADKAWHPTSQIKDTHFVT